MGNKAGYSGAILGALGLQSGSGADAYVWAEADQDVAALLRAYPNPQMLRRIAEIIRGWADEEPRALWERLRAERKARGARVDEGGSAARMWVQRRTVEPGERFRPPTRPTTETSHGGTEYLPSDPADACHRLAEYATIAASNRLINVADDGTGDLRNTGKGGTTFGGAEFATPPEEVAGRFEEVAGWVVSATWAYRKGEPESGYNDAAVKMRPATATGHGSRGRTAADEANLVDRATVGGWPPVLVLPTIPEAADLAAMLGTPGDLEGVVVYSDPDYRGTTGYKATCRDIVPGIMLGYAAMGAIVCVSEAVPIEELTAHGWHATEITGGRKGQKRTFARVATEWLTMNREPAHRVAVQRSLFGAA